MRILHVLTNTHSWMYSRTNANTHSKGLLEFVLSSYRRHHLPTIALITLAFTAFPPLCSALPQSDFYINQALDRYFSMPHDARALSMGGSETTFCRSSFCNYSNPAGLGFARSSQIEISASDQSISGVEHLSDEAIEQVSEEAFVAGLIPLGEITEQSNGAAYGVLGLGLSRDKGQTNDPINTTPDGHRRTLSYGITVGQSTALGYSLSFIDDQLRSDLADLHSHSRFSHLFGFLTTPAENWELGAVFQLGVGQSDTEDFQLKSNGLTHLKQYTPTLSIKRHFDTFFISASMDRTLIRSEGNLTGYRRMVVIGGDEKGSVTNIRLGTQITAFEGFFVRAGYRYVYGNYQFLRSDLANLSGDLRGSAVSGGLSADLGFILDGAFLEYGAEYQPFGKGEWVHAVSMSYVF
jgi:hypothetical protein